MNNVQVRTIVQFYTSLPCNIPGLGEKEKHSWVKPVRLYHLNNYFRSYDSRTIKVYEGPCGGLEGVSLTSTTEKLK